MLGLVFFNELILVGFESNTGSIKGQDSDEQGAADLLDHLVAEDVVAVEHLDGADGAGAGVARVLDLGEASLPDGLAELVRPHPRLPPRRRRRLGPRGLRHRGRRDRRVDRRLGQARAGRCGGATGRRGVALFGWRWLDGGRERGGGFARAVYMSLRWWARPVPPFVGETRGVRCTQAAPVWGRGPHCRLVPAVRSSWWCLYCTYILLYTWS